MAETVRWGVMGNANIARVCVIPAIQKSKNGRVRALATRRPAESRHTATEHNIAHVYDSYQALLDDPEIDAVYVPLPNRLHHPWTIKALQAGKHVLCEKPLACTAAQAREMAWAAEGAGKLLMEAFMYRFHPRTRRVKQLVEAGAIGRLRLIRSAFCFPMDEELLSSGREARLQPDLGGGALLDVGCYSVSVMRWLCAEEPAQLQAQAEYHPGGVDVHFVGSLRFAQGALATLEAGFTCALQQTFTVVGTEGVIELPHDAFIPWEKDAVFTLREKDQQNGQEHVVSGADQYQLMVEHFGDAVLERTVLRFSPQESIGNMAVLDALAEAAQTGRTIDLTSNR
jgi:predicted dehydrogenase